MSDRELIQYFKAYKGTTCGRFTEGQLNRDIPLPNKSLPWIKYFFQFSLPAFLLSLKSSAQDRDIPIIEVVPTIPKASFIDSTNATLSITGVVSDEGGTSLHGASIYLKGTTRGAITDAQGAFVLDAVVMPATLLISYVGYETKEVSITSAQQAMALKLKLAPAMMGEVVVAGYVAPKRIKRKEQKEIKKHQEPSITSSSILAYPNPIMAGSRLNIQCRSLERGSYLAEVYTLSGQLMQTQKLTYSKEGNQISLSIGELQSGTYVLRLLHETSRKQFSQQVVVQNQ
jgi:hypothetical protein